MDIAKVRFDDCYFCDEAVLVGEDYIEIRQDMIKPEDRSTVDPVLTPSGRYIKDGAAVGKPRLIMLSSCFMHRKCWYEYKLYGRRPNRHKGQRVGAKNGGNTIIPQG